MAVIPIRSISAGRIAPAETTFRDLFIAFLSEVRAISGIGAAHEFFIECDLIIDDEFSAEPYHMCLLLDTMEMMINDSVKRFNLTFGFVPEKGYGYWSV